MKLHGRSRTNPDATAPPVSGTGDERLQAHAPICAFLAHALPTARLALRTPPQPPCLLGALRSRAPLTRLTAWTDTAWDPSDPPLNNRKNTLINAPERPARPCILTLVGGYDTVCQSCCFLLLKSAHRRPPLTLSPEDALSRSSNVRRGGDFHRFPRFLSPY